MQTFDNDIQKDFHDLLKLDIEHQLKKHRFSNVNLNELVQKSVNSVNSYYLFPQISVKNVGASWGNSGDWHYYAVSWVDEEGLLNMIRVGFFK